MAGFAVGQAVRIVLPKGNNKRGVRGVSVLYSTSMEARFEGATGTITKLNPRGLYGMPVYLVDFRDHKNRSALPWQAHWFREEWLEALQSASARDVRTDQATAALQPELAPVPGPSGTAP